MDLIMYLFGGISVLVTLVMAFMAGGEYGFVLGFLLSLLLGLMGSSVFFALGKTISNQAAILLLLHKDNYQRKNVPEDLKTCSKCGLAYEVSRRSCPHCGYKA